MSISGKSFGITVTKLNFQFYEYELQAQVYKYGQHEHLHSERNHQCTSWKTDSKRTTERHYFKFYSFEHLKRTFNSMFRVRHGVPFNRPRKFEILPLCKLYGCQLMVDLPGLQERCR